MHYYQGIAVPLVLLSLFRLSKEPPQYTTTMITTGFPSPADDYIDVGIDLNKQLIHHPISTFFLRASGNSMVESGIHDRDLLLIDRSLDPKPNHIVVAIVDGAFALKRLVQKHGELHLETDHPEDPTINLHSSYSEVQVWGVAIYSIHNLNPFLKSSPCSKQWH